MDRLAGSDSPVASRLRLGVPLAGYTSFKVGGPADVLVDVHSAGEIAAVVGAAREAGLPYTIIGLGTNLLVLDGGVRGVVLRVGGGELAEAVWVGDEGAVSAVVVGAGVPLAGLARAAAARALSGLEFAEGIPGTVGGAIVMNAGAYGGEIGELVEWVEAVDLEAGTPGVVRLTRDAMGFGYRQSVVQNRALAVTVVKLRLKKGEPDEIGRLMAECAERRRSRQPLEHPSAGSFFRRPAGHYVGPMIEACGLKGYRVGGAEVSVKHANFIVNVGGATAADVLAVAAHVQDVVEKQYGVRLEPEVRVLGEGT